MDPYERLVRHIAGEAIDRPLNFDILMTFAAHYVGQPLSRYYLDHQVLVEANLAVQEAFELDIVQAISDPYREASDLGVEILFPEDGLPIRRAPLLTQPDDRALLERISPSMGPRMSDRIKAVEAFRSAVGNRVPIMGWIEGALAEAAVLRGDSALMLDLYDRPEWVAELLEKCTEVEIAFAQAQVRAGADIIGLGDAIASQISPAMYCRFALPYEQRIFAAVHEQGAMTRLHVCGDTTRLLPFMAQSGADIIDIDWMVGLRQAASVFGDGPMTCGNFDPVAVLLQGTPREVREATLRCQRHGGDRHISAAGCEVPDGTPYENLLAQAHALRRIEMDSNG